MRTTKEQKQEKIQKEKFAALFAAENAGTFGDIDATNALLGTAFDLCDDEIRRLIAGHGKIVPECGTQGKVDVKRAEVFQEADTTELASIRSRQEAAWRGDIAMPEPTAGKDEWCKKYRELEPVMNDIALGTVKSTAAQARILSNITDRCFGPVVKESEKEAASGVMLLPMIGSGAQSMICPVCGHIEEREDDEASTISGAVSDAADGIHVDSVRNDV